MQNRDPYFDNLKAILIFIVILGHFTNLNRSIPLMGAIDNMIYSFHMPLFIFISGYFSKNITSQRAAEIENVLYPYVVFQILNCIFTKLTGLGYGNIHTVFTPIYQNWYLFGLLTWRLLIPYYNLFNKKYSLLCTIIFSFSTGFFKEFDTSLGPYRVIYFFPIFILGYYCSDLKLLLNKCSKYKYYFICISLLGLLAIFFTSFFNSKISDYISTIYIPYSNYHHSFLIFFLRIIGFVSSLLISFGLLFLIPKNKFNNITNIGENTLNIFLLHMFFVFPINHCLVNVPSYLILLISLISSALICMLCSNKLMTKMLIPFTKLKQMKLLIKKIVICNRKN